LKIYKLLTMTHNSRTISEAEVRLANIGALEQRAEGDNSMRIGGTAAIFDTYTSMGWYLEKVNRSFFDGMDTTKTAALKNHDSNLVLGRTANNTLRLTVDDKGLQYEVDLPDTQIGRDTYEEVKRGDIFQSSFQFTVKDENWSELDPDELRGKIPDEWIDRAIYGGKVQVRELLKGGTLYDVAPVTFPAYQDTTVAKRSFDGAKKVEAPKNQNINIRLAIAKANAAAFLNSIKF